MSGWPARGLSFYRAFRSETGLSPVDFINAERLKLARNLLRKDELSVRQIALRCGFSSSSYFARRFRKAYGVSPAVAREKLN